MESLLFRFSHRIFGILVYWDFRMTERYNKKLLEHMNVIYSSIYTPVRDKVIVQTAQVVLIFRHAQEGHPACSRRSNMQ
jgi:hypothetical protein